MTSPGLFVPGGLIIWAEGMEEHNTSSVDPHTPPTALHPSACGKVTSNFPTTWGVQNRNEIATAAELTINSTLSSLCCTLYYNQLSDRNKICADGESGLDTQTGVADETELQSLCLENLDLASQSRLALLFGESARFP